MKSILLLTNREIEILTAAMTLNNGVCRDIAKYSNRSGTQTDKTLRELSRRGLIVLTQDKNNTIRWHFSLTPPENSFCVCH